MKHEDPRPILLKDYKPSDYLIDRVDLDISLEAQATRVAATLAIRPNPAAKGSAGRPLVLNGEAIELVEVRLNGRELPNDAYAVSELSLTLHRPPKTAFTLETVVTCAPEANKALSGLYRSRGIYCTQCEAEGFRRITYFLDRPDVLSVYTTRVEADRHEAATLLSNGNMTERGSIRGGNRHYAVWHDPHPKPSYLFALVGGNLGSVASTFKTMSGREVDLRIYVEPGKEDRCAWAVRPPGSHDIAQEGGPWAGRRPDEGGRRGPGGRRGGGAWGSRRHGGGGPRGRGEQARDDQRRGNAEHDHDEPDGNQGDSQDRAAARRSAGLVRHAASVTGGGNRPDIIRIIYKHV